MSPFPGIRVSMVSIGRQWAALLLVLLVSGCSQQPAHTSEISLPGQWHTFEGDWSATGSRKTISLEGNHHASIFDLTGSLLLIGDSGLGVGFRAKAIGFSDNLAGMQGRCVWTNEKGDQVYSELKGQWVGTGNRIVGIFLGGTGPFTGITGEYSFQWQYVIESEDGAVSGRAVNLKGWARFGSTAAAPYGEQPK